MHTLFTAQCTTNHALICRRRILRLLTESFEPFVSIQLFICIFIFYEPINCITYYYYYVLTLMNIDTYGFELKSIRIMIMWLWS